MERGLQHAKNQAPVGVCEGPCLFYAKTTLSGRGPDLSPCESPPHTSEGSRTGPQRSWFRTAGPAPVTCGLVPPSFSHTRKSGQGQGGADEKDTCHHTCHHKAGTTRSARVVASVTGVSSGPEALACSAAVIRTS